MTFFAPRDPKAAGLALRWVLTAAAAVLATSTVLIPPPSAAAPLVWVTIGLLLLAAVALRAMRDHAPAWICGLVPITGVFALALLDITTGDSTAAAQVFFLLPVIFAAAHLGRRAAWLITGIAMVGEGMTTVVLLPMGEALTDTVFLTAVAVVTTTLLVRSNGRSDALVAELRHLAAIDPLTGLVTRTVLDDAASCALTSADATAGTSFLLVDVDRFKGVNDHFGHPVGDAVLVHVGERLREVAGDAAVVSRLGGDEMGILLPGTSVATASRCARSISALVRTDPLALDDGRLVSVTLSIGVAHAPHHAHDLEGLYRAADDALYVAKRAGRDQVAIAGVDAAAA